MNKFAYIVSLGCAKNFVDTEVLTASLISEGIGLAQTPRSADIFLISTCSFIQPARREAESFIKDAIRWKKENEMERKIIVSGCLVQWDKNGHFPKKYPLVDLWLGIDEVPRIGRHIKNLNSASTANIIKKNFPEYLYDELTPRIQLTPRHFAYLKIAEGCANKCSYCVIPRIRGKLRSRSVQSVTKEAENLLQNGVKELILVAQDTTAFGSDTGNSRENIVELLRSLNNLKRNFWIRLLYTHPAKFTDDLIEVFKDSKHVLPYADIPIQHISNKILKSMNRKVNSGQIHNLLSKLRDSLPGIAIRTTFLTGYPGETEKDFRELCKFVEEQRFERLGVFTYSSETGTVASKLPCQISESTAEKRREEIMNLQSLISSEKNAQLVGRNFDVIIDSVKADIIVGRTYMDAPEIDNSILIKKSKKIHTGDIIKVKIESASAYQLEGVAIREGEARGIRRRRIKSNSVNGFEEELF